MKLLEYEFRLNGYCWEVEDYDEICITVCQDGLNAYFDMPEECEAITLSIHDKSSPNRQKCKVMLDCYHDPCIIPEDQIECFLSSNLNEDCIGDNPYMVDQSDLYPLLNNYIDKFIYIQVEY